MLKVIDILKAKSSNTWSISSRESVFRALEIMGDNDIEALAVTARGCVVGIFSESDYASNKILKKKYLKTTPVRRLMSATSFSTSPEKSIEECVTLMTDTRNDHLPVFENNKLIGIVSVGDMEESSE